ncbi:uncharacterized protein LOC106162679 [Lingula anatina]|uniref:Uncharacterized protein LOC106162679 n=1 Tax=Lingula anatina TaxID=7574 RepID=A0A1S3IDG9_LINAN|nr:uncharacterized protein LOC106162679 [Lingula anatina]|eukprot:XP_013395484.2 uncharacterized protein LOC106162679 [Lingula anatina]
MSGNNVRNWQKAVVFFISYFACTGANTDSNATLALKYIESVSKNNCSTGTQESLPVEFDQNAWKDYALVAVRTANLLTKLIHAAEEGNITESNIIHNDQFLFSLVQTNVEANDLIFGSAIAWEPDTYPGYHTFCPYAFRKNGAVEAFDLSLNYNYLLPSTEWYINIKSVDWSNMTVVTHTSSLRNNHSHAANKSVDHPLTELSNGHWTMPYFDCGGGDIWMVTFSAPFFHKNASNGLTFLGVTTIDIELTYIDINQCDNEEEKNHSSWFRNTHRCHKTTVVFVEYPKATNISCIIRPWLRYLGFALTYGALLLKTYRIAAIFEVSKFKKIKLTDKLLLPRLIPIVAVSLIYLTAWTVAEQNRLIPLTTSSGLKFSTCLAGWWQHGAESCKLGFLLWGVYLSFVVRKAPSYYNESKHISWSIYNTGLLGLSLYIIHQFIAMQEGPDVQYLMLILYLQVSVTSMMCLIYVPKFHVILYPQNASNLALQEGPGRGVSQRQRSYHNRSLFNNKIYPSTSEPGNLTEIDNRTISRKMQADACVQTSQASSTVVFQSHI